MEKISLPRSRPYPPRKLSRAAQALAHRLVAMPVPVLTSYELFLELRALYATSDRKALRLRKAEPDIADYERYRHRLLTSNVLAHDPDYDYRAYRIVANPDLSADEICCVVDPFCLISHLSAMERYGLTNRRPKALQLTRPGRRTMREKVRTRMAEDYGGTVPTDRNTYIRLSVVSHPARVRGRPVSVFETEHPAAFIQVRGTRARIATIGQTFLDMLEQPAMAGGMAHVLDVWRDHAHSYLEEIVVAVDGAHSKIAKVRAGYILDEVLGVADSRVQTWLSCAQRGGSRVLDPEKAFAPAFSEKWMLSLNV